MKKLPLLLTLLLIVSASVVAQDTLWVKQKEGKPYLLHKVKNGETLFLISKRYAVPPAILADINNVNYQDGLPTGSKFRIPIDNYNFIRIESVVKSKPIYFRVGEEDDLRGISRMFNVPQSAIQRWNNLITPDIETDKILQVGWIAYDNTQVPFAENTSSVVSDPLKTTTLPKAGVAKKVPDTSVDKITKIADTASVAEPSAFEELYYQQTAGVSVTEESGAAVFYPLKTKAGPGVYYAFHNTAIRGSILKIMNPANGKIIYAKVIGTLPKLKEYHNSIVGLSSNAISAMGARDQRMFCKLKYR
ncbi:MAG: LysM peptidoglycan-binding domain-containing protein [Taibaiella sp.]|jgi:LysM repeat protein